MPYIKQKHRQAILQDPVNNITTVGDLNFYLTNAVILYLKHRGTSYTNINNAIGALDSAFNQHHFLKRLTALPTFHYNLLSRPPKSPEDIEHITVGLILESTKDYNRKDNLNFSFLELRGAVRCVQLELYRRLAVPYEDEKIIENGDVY